MRVLRSWIGLAWLGLGVPATLAAQEWETARTRDLVARATHGRVTAQGAEGLLRWQATASGTVLFLAQLGGDRATPRLVKADQLAVEVYWEAPGRSKQTIVAWRDRAWLPTDVNYHRDHLGIVTNDFGPLIRIGEGDEVRDVPHPLSPAGLEAYEFGLADSVSVASAGVELQVYAVQVRPRDPTRPAVLGTLYLERGSAALVRFRFSFTRAAYLEAGLEDITVVLENALHAGRHWLPWRQEIEIRRRAGLVDFPARGIIRGRWLLGDVRLDDAVEARSTAGVAIAGLRAPGGPDSLWSGSLEQEVLGIVGPVDRLDFDLVRQEIRRAAGARFLRGGPPRPAIGAISDLARVNRVEGLRLGLGAAVPLRGGALSLVPWVGLGLADERFSWRLAARAPIGSRTIVWASTERIVLDMGQELAISPLLNSILAQEAGVDRGDWVERGWVGMGLSHRTDGGMIVAVEAGREGWGSREALARPARGEYRFNPPLGSESIPVVRLAISREASTAGGGGLAWRMTGEGGAGGSPSGRLHASGRWTTEVGGGELAISAEAGWASRGVPRSRGFVTGGWGTLPGIPYRGIGGRYLVQGRVEYLAMLRIPELPLGSFAGTGEELRLGPFLAAGAGGGEIPGGPGGAIRGIRPVAGIAVEGLFRLIRVEFGVALRGGRTGASADVARPWWGIL